MKFLQWVDQGGVTPFNYAPEFRMGSFYPSSFHFAPDGDGDGGSGDGDGDGDGSGDGDGDGDDAKKFTQADVNRMMKKSSDKHKADQQKTLDQLKTLKDSKATSDEQRADLSNRIREIEEGLMTEKDRSKAERDRLQKEHEETLTKEKGRADKNWGRYAQTLVSNEIANAATKHKAYRGEQLSAIVAPMTKVIEIKDSDGDGTGEYKVIVPTRVKKENSDEMVDKELSVEAYVATMKESADFANLFTSDKPGGTGFHPGSGRAGAPAGADLTPAQKVTEGIRQLRK